MGPLVDAFEPQASLAAAKKEFGEYGSISERLLAALTSLSGQRCRLTVMIFQDTTMLVYNLLSSS